MSQRQIAVFGTRNNDLRQRKRDKRNVYISLDNPGRRVYDKGVNITNGDHHVLDRNLH